MSAVHTFAPAGHGGRASSFARDGLTVFISGDGEESTEPAFELACELSRWPSARADLESQIARLRSDLEKARDLIPPKRKAQLLGPGYVRFTEGGEMWLLNNRERGFGEFGLRLDDWDELFRRFNVRVTRHGTDEHGAWWELYPMVAEGGAL